MHAMYIEIVSHAAHRWSPWPGGNALVSMEHLLNAVYEVKPCYKTLLWFKIICADAVPVADNSSCV